MIPEQQLRSLALNRCQTHMKAILSEPVSVGAYAGTVAWDPTELRNVFELDMVVWRRCSEFEVVLDAGNRPVGYIDHDKWADCAWVALPRERLRELVLQSGFLAGTCGIAAVTKGKKGCVDVVVSAHAEQTDSPRFMVQINPTTERVISILPIAVAQAPLAEETPGKEGEKTAGAKSAGERPQQPQPGSAA